MNTSDKSTLVSVLTRNIFSMSVTLMSVIILNVVAPNFDPRAGKSFDVDISLTWKVFFLFFFEMLQNHFI